MESQRITITIDASPGIFSAAGIRGFDNIARNLCPKSKRIAPISGVGGGRGAGKPKVAVTVAEPRSRSELNRRTKAVIDGVGARRNELFKRRKAVVPAAVRRSRSPIRSAMPALPYPPKHAINSAWKKVPPIPKLTTVTGPAAIKLTWDDGISLGSYHTYAALAGHELFACIFQGGVDNAEWEKLTFVKARPPSRSRRQPITCEMTDMARGVEYYFAVRPVDVHNRRGPFAVVYSRL